jgi:ATP-dependent DNA helicase RecQ
MPRKILNDVFGYKEFRNGQLEVIEALLEKANTLAVMPTGSGKSVCFQIPALIKGGLTIVVSPLVALMEDQVSGLKLLGVDAETINSSKERKNNIIAWNRVVAGKLRLLYLSPERLMSERMIKALLKQPISLIAIDEAHLISRWGASFRPDYEALAKLRHIFLDVPIVALTATADKSTQDDIIKKLFDGKGKVFVSGFDRPNINLAVALRFEAKKQLLTVLKEHSGESGIIYCMSRAKTEKMASFLTDNGYNTLAYHAGMNSDIRAQNQEAFMTDTNGTIMVATIAFGMGIDKPDVRFVIHMNMPGNIETYYQEIGRAGRDGKPAVAYMIYGLDDIRMRRIFIEQDSSNLDHKRREHKRLDALISYCESAECRRSALLGYFNDRKTTRIGCGNCDICINPPEMVEGTECAKKILTTVKDTGELFGQAHIIDILRGAKTEKIRSFRHDQLKSYGVGTNVDKNTWKTILRQLVAGRYLNLDVAGYGGLSIYLKGQEVLDGIRIFNYRNDLINPDVNKKYKKEQRIIPESLNAKEGELLLLLREKRTELARKRRVPPYLIFSDRSLEDIACRRPKDKDSFSEVHGVGAIKLRDFGPDFIAVVNSFICK